jgi:predicted acylesterase/phospholipase RssA
MDEKDILKQLQAAQKALLDTKAYATKLAQELAAKKAEINVFETVGVQVPKDIEALKQEDPDEYAKQLEKYKAELQQKREAEAAKAKKEALTTMLSDAAKAADIKEDLAKLVPPVVLEKYEEGVIDATKVVELAKQYESATKTIAQPTTTEEFDFTTVAGGEFVPRTKQEKDETLDPNDYIL